MTAGEHSASPEGPAAPEATAPPESTGAAVPAEPRPAPPHLFDAVDSARSAAVEEAADELGRSAAVAAVGAHLGAVAEDDGSVTHSFAAELAGYRGWRWAVTVASAGAGEPVTVSESVLLPGSTALVAPDWVPWDQRVRPDDLKPGDLLPVPADDPRLVPGYLDSGDPAVDELVREAGLGRERVLSAEGRLAAAERWQAGDRGPAAEIARSAPASCGTCGFLVPLAGALRGAFGVCANGSSPADGQVVAAGFGCGAHSSVSDPSGSPVYVSALVYDDGVDLEPVGSH
ncbi:DUF3027 domain-containing protein [Pseudonocardia parietis]|uniref:DUF3027 family protein n=1 Tax=Pseudonocardia parietis TaxID=570936 RepID=A0ABS4VNT1_9PSEU|nr:DUF3027 domain-containing protein [Pseudonocardia parietis]MBP2365586.1 hypothetical protein [Pseudonocardia parietis]